MTSPVEFVYLPMEMLLEHEETEPDRVAEVRGDIERRGVVDEPILVARESHVVLNGHHRFAALRALRARWVPVYLVDYSHAGVLLERWGPGPALRKEEVVDTARAGRLFPPKTTRHRLLFDLPHRPTPLDRLLGPTPPQNGAVAGPSYRPPPLEARDG
jgi:L-serine kinase (ADP)